MAELLLKVDQGANYEDGDIICAFNDHRISCCHAEMICHPKFAARNTDSLILTTEQCHDWYENTHLYKFERVSRREMRRTNLVTLESEILSDKPNDKGERIDVELYLQRRLKSDKHHIFGIAGNEIWYGGKKDFSEGRINSVWNAIENKTPNRKANFTRFPLGRLDVRSHLPIAVDNFNGQLAVDLTEPQYVVDGNGDYAWEADGDPSTRVYSQTMPEPVDGNDSRTWIQVVRKKRRKLVDFSSNLSLGRRDLHSVRDKKQNMDLRERASYFRNSVVNTKSN